MAFTQCRCHYTETAKETDTSQARFTEYMNNDVCQSQQRKLYLSSYNQRDSEIAVKRCTTSNADHTEGYSTKLVENIKVLLKDGKLVIPMDLQD